MSDVANGSGEDFAYRPVLSASRQLWHRRGRADEGGPRGGDESAMLAAGLGQAFALARNLSPMGILRIETLNAERPTQAGTASGLRPKTSDIRRIRPARCEISAGHLPP